MATIQTDRIATAPSSLAIKAPCRASTTANITLNGLQTVDGVSLASGDRVLVMNQTDQTTNGIYVAGNSAWARDADFDSSTEIAQGLLVYVISGTANGGQLFQLTTANPITLGTSNLTFAVTSNPTVSAAMASVVGASTLSAARTALGLAASATTDTTNATNIASGTLALARQTALVASGVSHSAGYAPDPGSSAGTTRFLREDATWASPPSSKVAQVVTAISGAVATGTTGIPQDDTIPQNTEGDQYLSLSITPTNASSKLVIDVVIYGAVSTGNSVIVALFQDSTANALAACSEEVATNNVMNELSFQYIMTAGTTIATVFKVRAGCAAGGGGTFTLNGQGGARLFGGVIPSSITITEVLP